MTTFSSRSGTGRIAPRIKDDVVVDGIRTLCLRTDVQDVVTIRGSMLGGSVFSPRGNSAIAEMTVSMLDQGTAMKDKFAISEILEGVGATVAFSSDNYRIRFTAGCLSKDIPLVVELLAEQLRYPAFHEGDLQSMKKRKTGELKRLKEDTRARAMEAFLQKMYPEEHPNFYVPLDLQVQRTDEISIDELRAFHGKHYGRGTLTLVAVGDVEPRIFEAAVKEKFDGWQMSPLTAESVATSRANAITTAIEKTVRMKDKTSVDLVMGQPIGIDRDHTDYRPLMMGHFILGGNFSARLMAVVRDERGLTYGIQSVVGGVEDGNDGFWHISGTFSPELLRKGREATLEQLRSWISHGVTKDELDRKKTTISGMYKIGLATTRGLASRILTTVERGRELTYIDEFPDRIRALTLKQVNSAIGKYCDAEKLVTVAAGSVADL